MCINVIVRVNVILLMFSKLILIAHQSIRHGMTFALTFDFLKLSVSYARDEL